MVENVVSGVTNKTEVREWGNFPRWRVDKEFRAKTKHKTHVFVIQKIVSTPQHYLHTSLLSCVKVYNLALILWFLLFKSIKDCIICRHVKLLDVLMSNFLPLTLSTVTFPRVVFLLC